VSLYTEYVPKFILQPLGMEHSALQINPQLLPHLAKGYEVGRDSIDSGLAAHEHEGSGYKMPNGAMYTTVGDGHIPVL
jgi:CubicO group peptidase (beta-lactamase class C family)